MCPIYSLIGIVEGLDFNDIIIKGRYIQFVSEAVLQQGHGGLGSIKLWYLVYSKK